MFKYTVLYFLCQSIFCVFCIDYDVWMNIKLEHNLGCNNENFCHRGHIGLKSIRSGLANVDQISFNKNHIQALKDLAKQDGFYSIKSLVTSAESKDVEYLSSVKAAAFLENGLSDMINVWVLPSGSVMAINFQVNNTQQPLKQQNAGQYQVDSKFYLHHVEQAPVPDTASYIQKLERDREAREKGDVKDNRSFLAKYWMYIVPIAIFMMISGAANPEAGGAPASR